VESLTIARVIHWINTINNVKPNPMLIILIALSLMILPCPALSQGTGGVPQTAAPNRPDDFPRRVAVYVTGGVTDNEKAVLGAFLLTSLVNSGVCISHENAKAFLRVANDQSRQNLLDDIRISGIGRNFGIKYICVASISPAFGAPPGVFTVFARMLNTETERSRLNGEATGPLKTKEELSLVANTIVEKMLGRRAPPPQTPPPEPVIMVDPVQPAPFITQEPEPMAVAPENQAAPINSAPAETAAQGKQTVAVYMAGEEPKGARGVRNIIGGELAKVLSESDKYIAVDRTKAILRQLEREHVYQRSGAVDDDQIKALGRQFGVQYLCISNINPVGRRYYLDTRLVDIVTAEIIRSVTATSNLKGVVEMARVGRNIAQELLEAEKTKEQRAQKKTIFRSVAVGLDVFGALAFAYGVVENNNVVKLIDDTDYPEADKTAKNRDIAYIVGGALLASGIAIHIIF
jgi:hypothetical protein